ncbi:MAG: Wzz/FepE/Etk N-terminal domain-containing protein, partial [Bacteroidota bacterium]
MQTQFSQNYSDELSKNETNNVVHEIILLIMKWKKFIFVILTLILAISMVVSLILPNWYKATASILPPKQQDFLSSFSSTSVLRSLNGLQKFGLMNQNVGVYNYLAILKSRTAMELVIQRFNLIKVYETQDSSLEETLKELRENVNFEVQDDDYITIEVLDKNKNRAAEMANYFVEILNTMSIELATKEATSNRDFIEKRLVENKTALYDAEENLKIFQEKNGTLILPDEASASLKSIADLYGMKSKKELEVAVLMKTLSSDNETLNLLTLEIEEIDKKISSLPDVGLKGFRLYRDVIIQQKINEYLVPMFEQAKISAQKDMPILLVLYKAKPAEKKSKQQRSLIVLMSL